MANAFDERETILCAYWKCTRKKKEERELDEKCIYTKLHRIRIIIIIILLIGCVFVVSRTVTLILRNKK